MSDAGDKSGARKGGPARGMRVAGVPEHFNAPWHLALAQSKFEPLGVDVSFVDYPGGTGDMCKALSAGEADVALLLTEGMLVKAVEDPKIRIVGVYVSTSAIWGVHAGAKSCEVDDIKDLKDKATFAISRYGSGSHLMSYVLADSLKWDTKEGMKFKEVGGLKGACEELPKDGSLVFMWEKFTTLPWVDDGTFKRIGELPTPWPFFSIAANSDFLERDGAKADLAAVLGVVKAEAAEFAKGDDAALEYIKEHYKVEKEPAAEWIKTVNWACEPVVDVDMLVGVGETLHRLGKIKTDSGSPPTREEIEATVVSLAPEAAKRAKTDEPADSEPAAA